jgi:hypothetical protein
MVNQAPLDHWNAAVTRTVKLSIPLSPALNLCPVRAKAHVCLPCLSHGLSRAVH